MSTRTRIVDDAVVARQGDSHANAASQGASSVGPLPPQSAHGRPLRVMQVVSSLELGGQERVVLDLSRGLTRRGHAVVVVSLAEGGALRPLFSPIPTRTVSRARGGGVDLTVLARLRRLFFDFAPDAVHTHNPTALLYGVLPAKLSEVPCIVHTKHGVNPTSRRTMLLSRRILYRICNHVVAVSEQTAEVAEKRERVAPPRLLVISNGVDVDAYARTSEARASVREAMGIPHEAIVLGTVGRLATEKNQALLIEAAAPLLGDRLRLVLVGDGPLRSSLERAVPLESQRYVHFTGARSDVARLLSAFDIFVLSSTTEGLPLVVPEAMAAGLPVVCTSVGGLPDVVVQGVTGRLVPSGNRWALRSALLELSRDSNLRLRLGEAAVASARRRFSLDRMISHYEALYRRA